MKTVESIKLSDVLKLVVKPRYILGTTYTLSLAFFESVVFPFVDRTNLKSCLILCDMIGYQRALTESSALLGAAQDYMVVPAPIEDCFHPKVWLVIGERKALLLAGSGNLTQAGFMTNAEYFDVLYFTDENPATPEIMGNVRRFLKGLAGMWPSEDSPYLLCIETLVHMEEALAGFPTKVSEDPTPRFLHSFGGSLIDQMPLISSARELYVAAPFFGNSLDGLNALVDRYRPTKLHVFPGVHNGKATDIPLKEVAKTYKSAKVARISVSGKSGAFAHLKLYGVAGDGNTCWLYCTSANCTAAAWKGRNVEAGLLRPVQPSVLDDYFVSDKAELPEGSVLYKQDGSAANTIYCWGSDSGAGLDLAVAASSRKHLPLRDVILTISAGSNIATCQKTILFQDAPYTYLPWAAFEGRHRPRKMAICLQVTARNAEGKAVHGGCLVENRLLLTADPIHRSAWRGALALLDAEGVPELADIAAIFTLARDLFDGTLLHPSQNLPGCESEPETIKEKKEPPSIAVWPPQPDPRDLQKSIGRTAAGQLQWFQRIMQTFLKAEMPDDPTSQQTETVYQSDDETTEDSESALRRKEEEQQRTLSVAERMWGHACWDYEHLRNRLRELCPTERQAPNLWMAAIFTFLPTIAVLRAAKRMAPDVDYKVSNEYLCEHFIRIMLDERKQHDDFCCPKGFRYTREKFPALADDLRTSFKVHIHPDLTNIMLALIADWKLRVPEGLYSQMWPKYVNQVCENDYHPSADNCESCLRIWRRYVSDETRTVTDAEFSKVFNTLCSMR